MSEQNEFDFLLDDLDTINELTKFDELNRGHKLNTAARGDTKTSRGNVVQDQTVVHYNKFVGSRQNYLPEPEKVATVFRETLYNVSSKVFAKYRYVQ